MEPRNFFLNLFATLLLVTSLYIYILCLSVCLFVSNKRQNGQTEQILCVTSRDPRVDFWMIEFSKTYRKQNSVFENFENPRNFCFCFVLQCTQREHVHNSNRRWALYRNIYIARRFAFKF